MIVEGLVELFFSMLSTAFSGFELINLPVDFVEALTTICGYGVWVVGADVMALFCSTVVGWWGLKFVAGIIVWLWELLPLT